MADLSKTIEIVFGGKNEVSPVVADIEKSFGALDSSVGKITDPLAKVADSVLKIDAALAAMAIGGMAYAIKQSSEFNKSFGLISTSVTATGADLAKYRDDILTYSTNSVKSLQDINSALYTAAQAGVKWTDSLEFIRKAEQLAVANNANLNTTVDLLTSTMNAYGFTLKDVGRLNDVFFQSTLIGKQTIDSLGQSMGQVVAIAANSGVTFEELSAAIATMTAKGLETSEAITAVKGVISGIISPSKEVADAAKTMGLNFSLTELSSKGFSNMLREIMLRTGGSKEKLVGLFNEVRAMNGVLQLTGDSMKFFDDALKQINSSAGNAERAYKKMAETFANQTQQLKNAAKSAMIAIGTELENSAAKITGSVGGLLKGIKVSVDSGAFDPLFKYLDEVGAAFSEWLGAIAKAFPDALKQLDFQGMVTALQAFGKELGGLDGTKPEKLAKTMQTLVDVIASLITVTRGLTEAFVPVISTLTSAGKAFSNLEESTKSLVGNVLGAAAAYKMFGPVVGTIMFTIGQDAELMERTVGAAFAAIGLFAENLRLGFTTLVWAVSEVVLGIMELSAKLPGSAMTDAELKPMRDFVDLVGGKMLKSSEDAWKSYFKLKEQIVGSGDASKDTKSKTEALVEALSKIPSNVTTTHDVKVNDTGVSSSVAAVREKLQQIPSTKVVDVVVRADGSTIEEAYGMIIEKFPDGSSRIVQANIVPAGVDETAARIADVTKPQAIDVQLKLDEEKLKTTSETIQKSVEWKAKIDIADITAKSEEIKSVFKSIDNSITSSSSLLGTLSESITKGGTGSSMIYETMRQENLRRDEMLKLQKNLAQAEVDNVKARTELMKKGEALIKVEAQGLQPHLEAFMFEILKAIQVRATAEGAKFLVG
ncbi:MAG TPA: phage tail tape measure protein [Syntrophales bacterium]|nr:phage tail tape measure protein [Syntrophales bacterium]